MERRELASGSLLEQGVVFLLASLLYGALGIYLVVERHLIIFDGVARLTHAAMVWHDHPAKLAAIGFVWPPLQTLVLLPFAMVEPMATSLVALPVSTAVAAGFTLAILWRSMTMLGLSRPLRFALTAVLALNPTFVFYAVNGMSEMLTIAALAVVAHGLVQWAAADRPGGLMLAAIGLAFAVMTRYGTALCAAIVVVAILIRDRHRRRPGVATEASLIAFLLPVVFVVALWIMMNWLYLGDPAYWLKMAGHQSSGRLLDDPTLSYRFERLGHVTVGVSLLTPLAAVALLLLALRRRSVWTIALSLLAISSALTTTILMTRRAGGGVFEPRYNMRSLPFVILGLAWIASQLNGTARRLWIALCVVAGLASIPIGVHFMETAPDQYGEEAFAYAIQHRGDLDGLVDRDGVVIGIDGERRMARYIRNHIDAHDRILVDDAQAPAVVLLAGPARFYNRVQRGDTAWTRLRDHPRGRVPYLLVTTPAGCRPRANYCVDLVRQRWPRMLSSTPSWLRLVYDSGTQALFQVLPR